VRQAMYQAIDINAIVSKTMRGAAQATGLMVAPATNGYNKEIDHRLPYDPARSRALLAEAGYPNGFSLTMHCSNDRYVNDDEVCAAAVGMLGQKALPDSQGNRFMRHCDNHLLSTASLITWRHGGVAGLWPAG